MKVLLINPPVENEILTCNLEMVEEERGANPPLGLLYIAAYLKTRSAHSVAVVDAPVEGLTHETIRSRIAKSGADVVGITAMTFTLVDVLKVASAVKDLIPGVKVVLGGPHVSIYPEETANLPGVDFIVLGEGEMTFAELLNNIDRTERLKEIKGIAFKCDGRLINTGNPDFIKDLDSLPLPARELTPYRKYSSLLASESPITTMFTSRGCPYKCSFCNRPNMGKLFRSVSAVRVVDEMQACGDMGIREILFYDDTFTVDKRRVMDICREIEKRGMRMAWDIRTRVDNVTPEMLTALKKAGCRRIHYGVESGSQRVLKILNKDIALARVIDVFNMTRRAGISTFGYFMIGAPTETRQEIIDTINFAKKLNPDYVQITIFTPFPGTPVYEDGLKDGTIDVDYWRAFAARPEKDFRTRYCAGSIPADELKGLLKRAYKEFYARPSYVIGRLLKIRTFGELRRKIKAGMHVLRV